MVPSTPVKIGDFTVTREIQEQGIASFQAALRDESPKEWRDKVQERIGVLELQMQSSPDEVALRAEKEILESFLREIYDKDPEELNTELLEEYL